MRLQVAIDRVPLARAKELVQELNQADIIEIGTSLSKDYGLQCVTETKAFKGTAKLLVDIKTIDEAAYEFTKYFEAGADILTVMGAGAYETVEICYQVAEKFGKEVLIDLLECDEERIERIAHFENAIYAMHFSKDSNQKVSVVDEVKHFVARFPHIKRIALAGGLNLETMAALKETPLEIAIVGSAIVGKEAPQKELEKYLEVLLDE